MEMSRVKDGNYYVVQSFMIKELKLKGLELNLYAIIYGFSQADNQRFTGSLQYLCDWTCSSKQAVINALKKLVNKELLIKYDKIVNNVKFVEYEAIYITPSKESLTGVVNKVDVGSQESLIPVKESLTQGGKETLPNKISYKKENNKKNNITNKVINNDKANAEHLPLVEPNIFIKELVKSGYIEQDELFMEQFNYFMQEIANQYGFDIARACLMYFVSKNNGYDENGNPILNKFSYFKTSIENGVKRINTPFYGEDLSEGQKKIASGWGLDIGDKEPTDNSGYLLAR